MTYEEIIENLVKNGQDPADFIIIVDENGASITPKWFYEAKQVAKKEDKPIIDDVNIVAELTTITAMDKDEMAEMLTFALVKIDELEAKING